jgi:hypothetical protein
MRSRAISAAAAIAAVGAFGLGVGQTGATVTKTKVTWIVHPHEQGIDPLGTLS